MEKLSEKLDEIARKYHDTKEQYYKDLWFKKVEEYGSYFNKRRIVSVSAINKADDGTYVIIGKRDRSV